LAQSCENIDEVIKEYHKLHPEDRLIIVDDIISDDTRDLVRQALKRTRDRGDV